MTFEEQLAEMARYLAESQRRWDERHEKLQQQLHNLAATVSEDHWRFQEDMRSLAEKQQGLQNVSEKFQQDMHSLKEGQQGLQNLVFQIAEGTARLLNTVKAHEQRLNGLEDRD